MPQGAHPVLVLQVRPADQAGYPIRHRSCFAHCKLRTPCAPAIPKRLDPAVKTLKGIGCNVCYVGRASWTPTPGHRPPETESHNAWLMANLSSERENKALANGIGTKATEESGHKQERTVFSFPAAHLARSSKGMTKVLAGYYQGNQHQLTSTGIHPRLVQNELLANLPFLCSMSQER